MNKVILMGNLTRDPETRAFNNGNSVASFAVAVNRKYKGSDGQLQEEVTFIDVDAFGNQGETIAKYFTKGKPILLEGRLKLDQWQSQSGENRSKLKVILDRFEFINSGNAPGGGNSAGNAYDQSAPPARAAAPASPAPADDIEDDVPF